MYYIFYIYIIIQKIDFGEEMIQAVRLYGVKIWKEIVWVA